MLPRLAQHSTRRGASSDQIAHRFMGVVRHPDCRQLAGPMQFGQRYRIAAVGLHPVTGPARDQRWRDHDAILPQSVQQPMHAIAARAGFIAKMKPASGACQLLDQASQRLRRRRDLTVKPHLAAASRFRERHRRALLVNVQPHECAMVHLARLLCMRLGARPSGATLRSLHSRDGRLSSGQEHRV